MHTKNIYDTIVNCKAFKTYTYGIYHIKYDIRYV